MLNYQRVPQKNNRSKRGMFERNANTLILGEVDVKMKHKHAAWCLPKQRTDVSPAWNPDDDQTHAKGCEFFKTDFPDKKWELGDCGIVHSIFPHKNDCMLPMHTYVYCIWYIASFACANTYSDSMVEYGYSVLCTHKKYMVYTMISCI